MISSEEGSLLLRLFIAHMLTDFVLQTQKGVQQKQRRLLRSGAFWWHILLTGIVAGLLLWQQFNWLAIAIIMVSHAIIDYGKLVLTQRIDASRHEYRDLWLFIIDQLLHWIVLLALWLYMIDGVDKVQHWLQSRLMDYRILVIVLAYLLVIGPVTYLIRFLTNRWTMEMGDNDGLQNAGKWIGMLERVIILTLVFVGQFTAIGFLVTAKSILRIIDKQAGPNLALSEQKLFSSRKHTEYVLIGTFFSYSAAIMVGLGVNTILG